MNINSNIDMINEVVNRRSTFFIKEKIDINNDNILKISTALNEFGLLPSATKGVEIKVTPNGIVPESTIALEMKTMDDSFKVVFGTDRIDIIRNKVSEDDNLSDLNEFVDKTIKVFRNLNSALSLVFTRLALCANICYDLDVADLDKVYKHFLIEADTTTPSEWQIRQVFKGQNNELSVNLVSTISRSMIQVGYEGQLKDRLLLEMDINTVPVANLQIPEQSILDFWAYAKDKLNSIMSSYSTKIIL